MLACNALYLSEQEFGTFPTDCCMQEDLLTLTQVMSTLNAQVFIFLSSGTYPALLEAGIYTCIRDRRLLEIGVYSLLTVSTAMNTL